MPWPRKIAAASPTASASAAATTRTRRIERVLLRRELDLERGHDALRVMVDRGDDPLADGQLGLVERDRRLAADDLGLRVEENPGRGFALLFLAGLDLHARRLERGNRALHDHLMGGERRSGDREDQEDGGDECAIAGHDSSSSRRSEPSNRGQRIRALKNTANSRAWRPP